MATEYLGLGDSYIDGQTLYPGAEIAFLHQYVSQQTNHALQAHGSGVLLIPDDTSLQVAAGVGLSVTVAVGLANVIHSAYGGVGLRVGAPVTLSGLGASATIYIHAGAVVIGGVDSRRTREASVFASAVPSVNGATLLAEVTTGAAGVTNVIDRRNKLTRVAFAGVYDATRVYYSQHLVTFGGGTWLAKRQSVGVTPSEGADWTVFAASGNAGTNASTTIKGIAKLSAAPVDAANPIVVGANQGVGGVLSGNILNPGFAVDMATQAELDSVAAAKADKSATILSWVYAQSFRLVSGTRDGNGALTTGSVVWPDGATGDFTADTLSTAFPGAIDAYHVTHVLNSVTTTYTQPAVTRDGSGAVTAQPAITVS